jgi:hypothetical protein
MQLLDKLEQKLGRFALPNVTLALVLTQVLVYVFAWARPEIIERMEFIPQKVLEGQFWRLATFLTMPPVANPLFAFFFWYLFYLMGTALEHYWGIFRFNLYLLIGYVATVAVAFVEPGSPVSNGFLQGSVFLAFAFLAPDFELYIMFLLPVKIKWLALLTWLYYGYVMIFSEGWLLRLLVMASACNFLLFFAKDIILLMRAARRRMAAQAYRAAQRPKAFHRCRVCGVTDLSHPKMEFRYCSKCDGACGYCTEHLHNHDHVTEAVK